MAAGPPPGVEMPLFDKIKKMLGMTAKEPMLDCEGVVDRLFEYLDGELEDLESQQVKDHLEVCKRCYPRAEFERAFLDAVRNCKDTQPCPDRVKESVLAAIAEAK